MEDNKEIKEAQCEPINSLSEQEFWNSPEMKQHYQENDVLNKNGGEIYGVISHTMLHLNNEQPSFYFLIVIYGFRKDNGVLEARIICDFDFDKTEVYIGGEKKDNLLYTILDWGGYSGINKFDGLKVKLKYGFNDKGLIVREINEYDTLKYPIKLIYTGSKCNTNKYIRKETVFKFCSPIFVDNLNSVPYGTYDIIGSCGVGETFPITRNELVKILGESIQGVKFDKVTYEWHIVMTVKQESDIEGDDSIVTTKFLFTLYDYKTYGELKDDQLYHWHIGCGWNVDNIGKKEYKSPFEKAFDKNNKGKLYSGGHEVNPVTIFEMYLYNEVLKLRQNQQNNG